MEFISILFGIIIIIWLANNIKEVSKEQQNKYLSVKDKINFDTNMDNFKKNLDILENNKNSYVTHFAKNYKFLFDRIYATDLKKTNIDISFKNLKILRLTINHYIENKKEISDPSSGYRAIDSYYEVLNSYLLKFNNIYFPLICNLDIEDYFKSLNELLNINYSEEIADRIGLHNSFIIYTCLKNIDYLFLRQDISNQQKETLENILKNKIES